MKIEFAKHHYDFVDVDKIEIYGLLDPRDNSIKYIGKAVAARIRYFQHLQTSDNGSHNNELLKAWLIKLMDLGLRPQLIIIEEAPRDRAFEREGYWISYYGMGNLFNQIKPTGETRKTKRPQPAKVKNNNVRGIRKKLRMSKKEFASKLDMPVNVVEKWEAEVLKVSKLSSIMIENLRKND